MFFRFFILADSGPNSHFSNPVVKSRIFRSKSISEVYGRLITFLQDYKLLQDNLKRDDLTPDLVYIVYGDDPDVCPFRSSNKRKLLFGFFRNGKPYSTLGCEYL